MKGLLMVTLKNIIIALSAAVVGLGSVYIFKMGSNNPVEQKAEQVIKNQTGVDVNLSALDTISTPR